MTAQPRAFLRLNEVSVDFVGRYADRHNWSTFRILPHDVLDFSTVGTRKCIDIESQIHVAAAKVNEGCVRDGRLGIGQFAHRAHRSALILTLHKACDMNTGAKVTPGFAHLWPTAPTAVPACPVQSTVLLRRALPVNF